MFVDGIAILEEFIIGPDRFWKTADRQASQFSKEREGR